MAAGRTWQKLNWQDPFLLEQQLTDEQRMARDTARQYASNRLLPRVQEAFRREETDLAIFREMGELGLLGLHQCFPGGFPFSTQIQEEFYSVIKDQPEKHDQENDERMHSRKVSPEQRIEYNPYTA